MRKRTIKCLCDSIFWHLIYLLPLILIALVFVQSGTFVNLSSAFQTLGLNVITTNPIYTALVDLFGSTGVIPLFEGTAIIEFLSYFVSVYLLHMSIDFLLFIPRLAMGWLDNLYTGGKHND